jgi:hypothetical protein
MLSTGTSENPAPGSNFERYFEMVPALSAKLKDEVLRVRHQVYCEDLGSSRRGRTAAKPIRTTLNRCTCSSAAFTPAIMSAARASCVHGLTTCNRPCRSNGSASMQSTARSSIPQSSMMKTTSILQNLKPLFRPLYLTIAKEIAAGL